MSHEVCLIDDCSQGPSRDFSNPLDPRTWCAAGPAEPDDIRQVVAWLEAGTGRGNVEAVP